MNFYVWEPAIDRFTFTPKIFISLFHQGLTQQFLAHYCYDKYYEAKKL